MGKIEDSIFENYAFALQSGNLNQAKRAVGLANHLKNLTEIENFIDYTTNELPGKPSTIQQFFEPFVYQYNKESRLVKLAGGIINLTVKENALFDIFSQNASSGESVRVVAKEQIIFAFPGLTKSGLRVLIHRLRQKIEVNPSSPKIIINFNSRGYIFLGKQIG